MLQTFEIYWHENDQRDFHPALAASLSDAVAAGRAVMVDKDVSHFEVWQAGEHLLTISV